MSEITRRLAQASIARDAASLRLERAVTSRQATEEIIGALLDSYYPLVGVNESGDSRFMHLDIAGMEQEEFWAEAERCKFLLAWVPLFGEKRKLTWLRERYRELQAEQRRRSHGK